MCCRAIRACLALLLGLAPIGAQAATLFGPLSIPNALGEIATAGLQSQAQTSLFGHTLTLGGSFATSGSSSLTLTTTGPTALTLPTSGTLFTTSGGTITGATTFQNNVSVTGLLSGPVINLSSLVSGTNSATWGTDPNQNGDVLWQGAPVRIGGNLTLAVPIIGSAPDEFLTTIQANEQPTPFKSGATNAATAAGNAVLHFAAIPVGVVAGMMVTDVTHTAALPATLTVLSTTATTVTLSGGAAASGVSSGDTIDFGYTNFKGPLFAGSVCYDPSDFNIAKACNGITSYSDIATGVSNAFAEGLVSIAEEQGTGSGSLIGAEADINANSSSNSFHCDASAIANCHTNVWLGTFGTQRGSWAIDSSVAGPGWNNGISLRNIAANGLALAIPNATIISAENAAGTAPLEMMELDTTNSIQIGASPSVASIVLNANVAMPEGQIGTATGVAAAAGTVGEYQALVGASAPITSNTAFNSTNEPLSAGDWWCTGTISYSNTGANITLGAAGLNTVAGTLPTPPNVGETVTPTPLTSSVSVNAGAGARFNLSANTTIYLNGESSFASGTETQQGALACRRMR